MDVLPVNCFVCVCVCVCFLISPWNPITLRDAFSLGGEKGMRKKLV